MKHRLPPLDRFKVFERAATLLSFTAAAQELCVSKGAVSYQIRMLEQEIGVELFNRSVRQVLLTDTGQLLLKSVERAFGELEDSLGRIHHLDPFPERDSVCNARGFFIRILVDPARTHISFAVDGDVVISR